MTQRIPKGTKVVCIEADPATGIPIKEGETYTVRSWFRRPDDCEIAGLEDEPGVTLEEDGGTYLAKRFRLA